MSIVGLGAEGRRNAIGIYGGRSGKCRGRSSRHMVWVYSWRRCDHDTVGLFLRYHYGIVNDGSLFARHLPFAIAANCGNNS
jgi:hypothetical protein